MASDGENEDLAQESGFTQTNKIIVLRQQAPLWPVVTRIQYLNPRLIYSGFDKQTPWEKFSSPVWVFGVTVDVPEVKLW